MLVHVVFYHAMCAIKLYLDIEVFREIEMYIALLVLTFLISAILCHFIASSRNANAVFWGRPGGDLQGRPGGHSPASSTHSPLSLRLSGPPGINDPSQPDPERQGHLPLPLLQCPAGIQRLSVVRRPIPIQRRCSYGLRLSGLRPG